jgi:hypothetical protein
MAVALASSACTTVASGAQDEARRRDEEVVVASAAEIDKRGTLPWIVIQDGVLAAFGASPAEAIRAAPQGARAAHRFVFRADDRGDRFHRLAFLPQSGVVAGRRLFDDLGFRIVSVGTGPERRVVVERRGERRTLDLATSPALGLTLTPIDGGATVAVDVPFDPDFDGPLVVPAETARPLATERAEIPGRADVHVALGRPFSGRRAWVSARCDALDASGLVEVVVPDLPARR